MSVKQIEQWKNRIVGYSEKPAKDFCFNPLNWREHPQGQRDSINEVLAKIGWVTGVVENRRTGHLIDGHLRIEEALEKNPNETIPFITVDISEEEEKQILAILDPLGAMAETNAEKFAALAEIIGNTDFSIIESMRAGLESPEIDLDEFFISHEETAFEPVGKIVLEYPADEAEAIKKALKEIDDEPEEAVRKLLGL